jgi:signal peptidase II
VNTPPRTLRLVLIVVAIVVAADQALKAAIVSNLFLGERVEVLPGFALVSVRNNGIAFDLLSDANEFVVLAVTLAALAILLAVFARNSTGRFGWLGVGLIVGGALGNLIDRVRDGAVVDFIKIDLWPAFNLADTTITVGIVVLVLGALRRDPSEQGEGSSQDAAPPRRELPAAHRAEEGGGSIGETP